jgi:hypothetical protein
VRGGAGRGARQRGGGGRHGMEDAVAQGWAGGGESDRRHRVDRRDGGGVRAGDTGLNGRVGDGGRASRRDAQGRTSSVGSVGRAGGECGDVGVRARGGAPISIGRLDRLIQVIDLCSTTLDDE